MSDCGSHRVYMIKSGARLLLAPTLEAMVADTLAAGSAWGGNWVDVGELGDAITLTETFETEVHNGQYGPHPYDESISTATTEIAVVIDWAKGVTIQKIHTGTLAVTAQGVGQPGVEVNSLGARRMDCFALGIEALDLEENAFRVYSKRVKIKPNGEMSIGQAESIKLNALISCMRVPQTRLDDVVQIRNITAVAL